MNYVAIMVGALLMSVLLLTKFVKALYFLLPFSIPMFLGGMIACIVGVSTFDSVQKFSKVKKTENPENQEKEN